MKTFTFCGTEYSIPANASPNFKTAIAEALQAEADNLPIRDTLQLIEIACLAGDCCEQ